MRKPTTPEDRARRNAKNRARRRMNPETRAKQKAAHDKYRARPEIRARYQKRQNDRVEAHLVAEAGRPRPELCEVCGRAGGIEFDHCHQRNIFRGWLCGKCNSTLGFVDDDPNILRKLIAYLERTAKLVPPQLTLPGI